MESITTIEQIEQFTDEDQKRLETLLSEDEMNDWVDEQESNERTSLQFKRWANRYLERVRIVEDLLNDDVEDSQEDIEIFNKMLENYKDRAIKSYNAYIKAIA